MSKDFSRSLDEALGIDSNKKNLFKPDGVKKKSAKGPHRPDNGTDYTQLTPDRSFKNVTVTDLTDVSI